MMYGESSAASKVEESVAMFLSFHCNCNFSKFQCQLSYHNCNCNHLIDILRDNLSDNKVIYDVKQYRSNYTNIIKKNWCPHFYDLKRDIGGNKYILLLDESNDASN